MQPIKKFFPKPVRLYLSKILKFISYSFGVSKVSKRLDRKKKSIYIKACRNEPVRVVFLVLHKSTWKVDSVFQKMQEDPFFEPIVFICPFSTLGDEAMWEELRKSIDYFENKGYQVISSFDFEHNEWRDLDDLEPDLIFFTNPYALTKKKYYKYVYINYLTAYVPYYYMATNHAGTINKELNEEFFHFLWRLYCPHQLLYESFYRHVSQTVGDAIVTGYPATERFVDPNKVTSRNVWKQQLGDKKKVIYAPHHTISDSNSSLSTFLLFGEYVRELSCKFKDNITWAFKPHPLLKEKLYDHKDWGLSRTDAYYNFWEENDFTQLNEGEYEELFLQSDAIIHDCSSFIVEYAFLRNPSLYLLKGKEMKFLNDFGRKVFDSYHVASSKSEIVDFLESLISKPDQMGGRSNPFLDKYIDDFYRKSLPSQKIIDDLKSTLIGEYQFSGEHSQRLY